MSEANNYYVGSRGIMKTCTYYSITPYSSIRQVINYPSLTNKIRPTIYICSSAIPHFIQTLFKQIDFTFILVSGDCDETIPYDIFKTDDEFNTFIGDKRIIHWFCQNWIGNHKKVSLMPIGLDYHTMATRQIYWGPITTPEDQEKLLMSLKSKSKPFYEREIKCYGNYHFLMNTKYGYDRIDAYNNIDKSLMFYEENKVLRLVSWKNQIQYAFVISPHGNGLDCHRTWEALVLGCIPIVKTSKIDSLYEDLPILIVNDWKDINYDLLVNTINNFKNKTFNYDKLTLKYWIDKINSYK
jgi:hypothetical protein